MNKEDIYLKVALFGMLLIVVVEIILIIIKFIGLLN